MIPSPYIAFRRGCVHACRARLYKKSATAERVTDMSVPKESVPSLQIGNNREKSPGHSWYMPVK